MATGREYQNFDLIIEQSGDKFRARVINSPCGQASVEFDKPFSPLELENFVLRMGRPRSGMRRIDSPEMHAAKDLGRQLFTTVFSGEVNACYLRSIDSVLNQNKGLRVRLHINVPEFNDLPWEFLYNPQFSQFVALSQNTPIIRYIELPYTTRALPVQTPLKILVMISSPEGYPQLDVDEEWEMLNRALKPLIDQRLVVLEKLEHPTLSMLQKKLRQDKVHIFHYIGHGKYFEDKQDGMLLLEDETQRGRPTSGQQLGAILHDHYHLRLVVLNACEGARTSAEDPYAGVAQTLVRQGIPAVLAMQFEIFEDAALTFAEEFYSAIVDNYPVDAALSEARKAIFASNNDVEWGTPVLFMRTPDGILFRTESAAERAERLAAERVREEQKKKEEEAKKRAERREQEEREATEKAAEEKAEREAAEKAVQEKAEREAAEKAAREKAERIAAEKAARENAKREAIEKASKERVDSEVAGKISQKPLLSRVMKYILGGLIIIAIIIGGIWGISYLPNLYKSTPEPNIPEITYKWQGSAHNDETARAFNHWNNDDPREVPISCAKCHSIQGFLDFLGFDGSSEGIVDNSVPAPAGTISCQACHKDEEGNSVYKVKEVTFPSGATVSFGSDDSSNLCINCHQGRVSKISVDQHIIEFNAASEPDLVQTSITFQNIHYFAAGVTLFGTNVKGAYEYDGKPYLGFTPDHRDIRCLDCHDVHSLKIKIEYCQDCHEQISDLRAIRLSVTDYDGDGNITEGIDDEINTLTENLYREIQNYATSHGGAIVYDSESYPFFFDVNGERYSAWTPRLLKASYNYQVIQKDLGAFSHNPRYIIQLLFDSIEDLGGDTSRFIRPKLLWGTS